MGSSGHLKLEETNKLMNVATATNMVNGSLFNISSFSNERSKRSQLQGNAKPKETSSPPTYLSKVFK